MNKENSPGGDESLYGKVGKFVSIFQRGEKWYANYQHAGKQIRKSLKTQSKKEARRRALLIEKEILAGDYKHHQCAPSIAEAIEKYLAHLNSEGRASKTVDKYEFCFDLLQELATRTKKTLISQVDFALIDLYRAVRTAGGGERKPGSPKTVHNDTVTIRQLVNFARRRGMIRDDPLKALKIKKPMRTPQPWWTRDQVLFILAICRSPHLEPLTFLAETGARIGEGKWLTWEDVDFTNRLIHIRAKEGWRPKTGGERVVPMTDRLRDMLAKMPRAGDWVFSARVTKRHPDYGRQISERRLLQYLKGSSNGSSSKGISTRSATASLAMRRSTMCPNGFCGNGSATSIGRSSIGTFTLPTRSRAKKCCDCPRPTSSSRPELNWDLISAQFQHNRKEQHNATHETSTATTS